MEKTKKLVKKSITFTVNKTHSLHPLVFGYIVTVIVIALVVWAIWRDIAHFF